MSNGRSLLFVMTVAVAALPLSGCLSMATMFAGTGASAGLPERRLKHPPTKLLVALDQRSYGTAIEIISKASVSYLNKTSDANGIDGGTALHLAARSENTELVRLLLEKGAKVNAVDSAWRTPLHWAVTIPRLWFNDLKPQPYSSEQIEIVQLLLKSKADVEATDLAGDTALLAAINVRSVEFVRLLLQHGVEVNHADKLKATPLQIATSRGYKEIVALLLAHGAR